ncbi:MAG: alkaline phosphatase family protein [Planctomycetota bacterium]|nr:alkaline phosphatase family protein [Planctomycetota bacterium]
MIPLLFALTAQLTAPREEPVLTRRTFENAIVISVDGLRSDALIAISAKALPAFARLRRGASTLNARTDPDWTITLPNHTAMITGRFVEGDAGHAWTKNDDADAGETLESVKGSYVAGLFDVAHDRGFETQLYAGKSKFSIYDVSWNAEHGAPDVTGEDDGRDKLDRFVFELDTTKMVDGLLESLAREQSQRRLYFVHFAVTDLTGHAYGWDVSPNSRYMKAVQAVDVELARLLDALESSKLRDTTAIVLTADHGGGAPFKSHDQKHMWVNYIIPFIVWTGASGEPRDLYELNSSTRADPGLSRRPRDFAGLAPVRNGDAGNLALHLLGLSPVPGSTIGNAQDLRVFDSAH